MEKAKLTVLITGATAGVGYELSKLFARDNHRMVIVGPEPATLHNVSEVLKTLGALQVFTICKDLRKEGAADELFAEIIRQQIATDLFINDAATVLDTTPFLQSPADKDAHAINRGVLSLLKLTKSFAKQMALRNKGMIVQLSLSNAPLKNKVSAIYKAVEAFVSSFMNDVAEEVSGAGVTVKFIQTEVSADEMEDSSLIARKVYNNLFSLNAPSSRNSGGGNGSKISVRKTKGKQVSTSTS